MVCAEREKNFNFRASRKKIFNQRKNILLTLIHDSFYCVFTYFTYSFMFNSDFLGGPKDISALYFGPRFLRPGFNSKSRYRYGSELNVHCMCWPCVS